MLPGVFHAPFGHVEDLKWFDEVLFDKLVSPEEVAAIILEPIQGEGGYVVPEDGFLAGVRAICDKHGILLIADEVQSAPAGPARCGPSRTGTWSRTSSLRPRELPAACPWGLDCPRVDHDQMGSGAHGTTYGGNPSPARRRSRRSSCSKAV